MWYRLTRSAHGVARGFGHQPADPRDGARHVLERRNLAVRSLLSEPGDPPRSQEIVLDDADVARQALRPDPHRLSVDERLEVRAIEPRPERAARRHHRLAHRIATQSGVVEVNTLPRRTRLRHHRND